VVTVHDSVMTTEPDVQTVKGIIRQEFAKFGIIPTIREKHGGVKRGKIDK
jgi:hypothetical protein